MDDSTQEQLQLYTMSKVDAITYIDSQEGLGEFLHGHTVITTIRQYGWKRCNPQTLLRLSFIDHNFYLKNI